MVIGLLATVITVILGALIGISSGFIGGRTDSFLMRITDFFLVLPTFVLALILAPIILDIVGENSEIAGVRMTLIVIVIVIGITRWASTARIIRSQTLRVKERAFVDRARVIGSGQRPHHAPAHPPERDQPDRRQRRPGVRRRDPDRDDPGVHRARRPVRPVVGADPQLGRGRGRAGARGVVVHRPAGDLHRPRRARRSRSSAARSIGPQPAPAARR